MEAGAENTMCGPHTDRRSGGNFSIAVSSVCASLITDFLLCGSHLKHRAGVYVREGSGSVQPQNQVFVRQTWAPGLHPPSVPLRFTGFLLRLLLEGKLTLMVEPVCSFQGQKKC